MPVQGHATCLSVLRLFSSGRSFFHLGRFVCIISIVARLATLFQPHSRPFARRSQGSCVQMFGMITGCVRKITVGCCVTRNGANSKAELSTTYDPAASELYFNRRLWWVGLRMFQVVASAAGFLVWCAWTSESISQEEQGGVLCDVLTGLGPTFVKLGQTLATRPDLVGEGFSAALTQLQTATNPFSNALAREVLEVEVGKPIADVFSRFGDRPVAAASLGQVYCGILAKDGVKVAVKIQRPNLLPSIALDIYILRVLLGIIRLVAKVNRDIRELADDVGAGLYGELDYLKEAAQAEEFACAHSHLPFVVVPEVVHELTTQRVLTTRWVDGFSPSALLKIAAYDVTDEPYAQSAILARQAVLNIVNMGVQCSLCQLLETGVMHADPHPGNLMLSTLDGKLVYLDFGLLARVPPETSEAMMSALIHLVLREWSSFVDDLDAMGLLKLSTNRKALAHDIGEEFAKLMNTHQENHNGENTNVEDESSPLTVLLSSGNVGLSFRMLSSVMVKMAVKYRFRLPPYYTFIVRSLVTLEGIALKADADFKIVKAAFPYVVSRLVFDERKAAVRLLRELLLRPDGTLRMGWVSDLLELWDGNGGKSVDEAPKGFFQKGDGRGDMHDLCRDNIVWKKPNGGLGCQDLPISTRNEPFDCASIAVTNASIKEVSKGVVTAHSGLQGAYTDLHGNSSIDGGVVGSVRESIQHNSLNGEKDEGLVMAATLQTAAKLQFVERHGCEEHEGNAARHNGITSGDSNLGEQRPVGDAGTDLRLERNAPIHDSERATPAVLRSAQEDASCRQDNSFGHLSAILANDMCKACNETRLSGVVGKLQYDLHADSGIANILVSNHYVALQGVLMDVNWPKLMEQLHKPTARRLRTMLAGLLISWMASAFHWLREFLKRVLGLCWKRDDGSLKGGVEMSGKRPTNLLLHSAIAEVRHHGVMANLLLALLVCRLACLAARIALSKMVKAWATKSDYIKEQRC